MSLSTEAAVLWALPAVGSALCLQGFRWILGAKAKSKLKEASHGPLFASGTGWKGPFSMRIPEIKGGWIGISTVDFRFPVYICSLSGK